MSNSALPRCADATSSSSAPVVRSPLSLPRCTAFRKAVSRPFIDVVLGIHDAEAGRFRFQAVGPECEWSGTVDAPNPATATVDAISTIRAAGDGPDRVRFIVAPPVSKVFKCHRVGLEAALPDVLITGPATAEHTAQLRAIRRLLGADDDTPPPPAQVVCDDPITVATDASVSRGITGFGVLADDGQYQLMAFPHQRKQIGSQPVLVAELRGINEAVRKFGHRPLTILTDSQESVAMVNRWRAGDEVLPRGYTTDRAVGLAGLVEAQRRVRKHRDRIDIRWVRGHDGHLLNEGADALAKLARRYRLPGSGLTPSEYRRRAAGLADGFAAAFAEQPH